MGWGRTLLLGNIGAQLNIDDVEADVEQVKQHLRNDGLDVPQNEAIQQPDAGESRIENLHRHAAAAAGEQECPEQGGIQQIRRSAGSEMMERVGNSPPTPGQSGIPPPRLPSLYRHAPKSRGGAAYRSAPGEGAEMRLAGSLRGYG